MKLHWVACFAFLLNMVTLSKSSVNLTTCDPSGNDNGRICQSGRHTGLCYMKECFVASPTTKQVLIKVRYMTNNSYFNSSKFNSITMWLRGSDLGLRWEKGKQMKKSKDKDTWEFLINFTLPDPPSEASQKQPVKLEFRVYLDDSKDMLGANFLLPLPLSTSAEHLSDWKKVPEFWAYPWFFREKGTTTQRTIYSPELQQYPTITIYTPPSFDENGYKRYETLFFNDGQRLKYMLIQIDTLIVQKALLKELVIIGLVNDFSNRTELLAPSNGTNVECKNGNFSNNCDNCLRCAKKQCNYRELIQDYTCYRWYPIDKVRGQSYLDFIQKTLIPESQKSYRAIPGSANVGIIGFSFGGLISCHAMWTRPHTFGSAACMSPSFWWPFPVNGTFPDDARYEFVKSTLLEHRGARPRQKVYIDVGSLEGDIMVDPARNASRILAESAYFEMNKNLWFYIWGNQYHDFKKSFDRIWVALLALYGAEGSPTASGNANKTPAPTIASTSRNTQVSSGQARHQAHVLVILGAFIAFLQSF